MSKTSPLQRQIDRQSPIITIPNPNLRLISKPVTQIDKKTKQVLDDLRTVLTKSGGVGLAAPQINYQTQIFATYLPHVIPNFSKSQKDPVRFFINPKITATSPKKSFSKENDGTYTLEGCLSLPGLYAPIPRYDWVDLTFQEINPETNELTSPKTERFTNFYARNMQHEYDHLQGVLFTDYLRDNNIILYRENPQTGKLEEVIDLDFIYAY